MKKLLVSVRVEVTQQELDDEVYANTELEEEEWQEETVYFRSLNGYLHHWGIDSRLIEDKDGPTVVQTFSVVYIEEAETGKMYKFFPEEVTILNYVTYK